MYICVNEQVQDYYIMIQLNKYDSMVTQLLVMLKVMVSLRSPHYIKGVLMNMLIFTHQKKHMLAPYRMFAQQCSSFNEEAGEISLSVLNRVSRSNPNVHDIQHCSHLFMLCETFLRIGGVISGDAKVSSSHNRVVIDSNSEEVKNLVTFLNKHIKKIQKGKFVPYRKLASSSSMYLSKEKELTTATPLRMRRLLESNNVLVFDYAVSKAQELMNVDISVDGAQSKLTGGDPVQQVPDLSEDEVDTSSDDEDRERKYNNDMNGVSSSEDGDSESDDDTSSLKKNPLWLKSILPETRVRKVSFTSTHSGQRRVQERKEAEYLEPRSVSSSSRVSSRDVGAAKTSIHPKQPPQTQSRIRGSVSSSPDSSSDGVLRVISEYAVDNYVITRPLDSPTDRFWIGKINNIITSKGTVTNFGVTWLVASAEHGPYVVEKLPNGKPHKVTIPVTQVIAGFRTLESNNTLREHVVRFLDQEYPTIPVVQPRKKRKASTDDLSD